MLFVQNMIDTNEGNKTEVAGQCVPSTYLTSSYKSGTESPVFMLSFHYLNRTNAQWWNLCLSFSPKLYVRCLRKDEKGVYY